MNRYFYPGRGPADDKIKAIKLRDRLKREFKLNGEGMNLAEFLAFRWANVAVAKRDFMPEDKLFEYRGCGLPLSSCFRCASGGVDSHCLYETIRMAIINALESYECIQETEKGGAK